MVMELLLFSAFLPSALAVSPLKKRHQLTEIPHSFLRLTLKKDRQGSQLGPPFFPSALSFFPVNSAYLARPFLDGAELKLNFALVTSPFLPAVPLPELLRACPKVLLSTVNIPLSLTQIFP